MKRVFVTGGAGFIGSAFIKKIVTHGYEVLNYDKLTYASNIDALESVKDKKNYCFFKGDICNEEILSKTLAKFSPDIVAHFAAESHVDNSIETPAEFINTNIVGTYNLLNVSNNIFKMGEKKDFKFIHISTDEVYGDLGFDEPKFTVHSKYNPNSPYAASKAASDHLVHAWNHTYNFPAIITHCSNNYGPWQNQEKFIPTVILNVLRGNDVPVYGKGDNVRDWIYVDDHVNALVDVMKKGEIGETYNIGGNQELKNIELAKMICSILDEIKPGKTSYSSQIRLVTDRLGHDRRYAIDNGYINKTLGWSPKTQFSKGIRETIEWYVRKYD